MDGRTREELEDEIAELRATIALLNARLLSLVRLLPPDVLALVPEALETPGEAHVSWSPTSGWLETVELTSTEVGDELAALWRRAARHEEPEEAGVR